MPVDVRPEGGSALLLRTRLREAVRHRCRAGPRGQQCEWLRLAAKEARMAAMEVEVQPPPDGHGRSPAAPAFRASCQ